MASRLLLYLRIGRFAEVLLILGAPLLGILFAIPDFSLPHVHRGLAALLATGLLTFHVYFFNAWAGYALDKADVHKQDTPLVSGAVPRGEILLCSVLCLVAGLAIFGALSLTLLALAGVTAANWMLYAHPWIALKKLPVVPTVLHVVGGALAFLLTYVACQELNGRGLWIALYFGLILAAGHLNHELLDYEADLAVGFRTLPARVGKTPAFLASFSIFTLSSVLFCILTVKGMVPDYLYIVLLAIYPFHAYFVFRAYRSGICHETMHRLRSQYRTLYALAGLYMVAVLILSKLA